MKKYSIAILVAALIALTAGSAVADTFTSVVNVNQWITEQGNGSAGSITYWHNLAIATPPLTIPGDTVTSATLTLLFSDDEDPYYSHGYEQSYEYGLVTLDGVDVWGWSELNDGQVNITVNPSFVNVDGLLQVRVSIDNYDQSQGDIYLGCSTLAGEFTPCQVPVPGAVLLGMLGLSVAGARLRKNRVA